MRASRVIRSGWVPILLATAVTCALIAVWLRIGPLPAGLLDDSPSPSTIVVDRHGVSLHEALSSEQTRAVRLAPDALPPMLVAATVAAEDRRFFRHAGVDPLSIARALKTNLVEGAVVEGGSTISQQAAKLLLNRLEPGRARGVAAKMREAVVALRLEHRFTKRELLALYLNIAPYGNQYVGAERASRGYFGLSASQLTPAQAAFLAGLPQRPSGFNPYRNRDAAIRRQRSVLRRMGADEALTAEQVRDASAERVTFVDRESPFLAPHFVQMVLDTAVTPRPARIVTTLDAALQKDVVGIIASHRETLRRHGARNVAVVVLDNATGEWLAWEGSGDYFNSGGGTLNGPVMPRQPGSALKPFTYAVAFENGFSPATVLADLPSSFPTAEPGVVYSPRNYDGRYRGPLLARHALAGSENVPAVVLASNVGVPTLLRFLNRAGITTLDKTASHYGLGITLGNAEVRLDELVAGYAAFARGGEWIEPSFTPRSIAPRTERLMSSRTAFWITDILADAEARAFVFGRGGSLELPFSVAVKTGTSQAYHDNWTIGYSRHVTVGVWVGNFDRTPLRNSSGVTGAGPIFHAVMLAAERRVSGASSHFSHEDILTTPSTSVQREICALSGQTANQWCPLRRREWVASESPSVPCSWHHHGEEGLLTFWPAEYRHWTRQQGLDDAAAPVRDNGAAAGRVREVAALARGATSEHTHAALTIVSPPPDSTYLIDPTLRRDFQTLPLRAVSEADGPIEWSVSGHPVASTDEGDAFEWPLVPGRHHIVARDRRGRTAETVVTVR
jgi:penicillin-binding protein 1C